MEFVNEIVGIVNSLGFPIACVVGLAWYANNTTDKLIKLTEKVTDTVATCTATLNSTNDVLEKVLDKI